MSRFYGTYILCFLLGVLCLFACDDYFDPDSESTFTDAHVFENPDLTSQAVVGIYSALCDDNLYSKKLSLYYSMNTDIEYISGDTDNGRRGIARYVANSTNTELYGTWTSLYKAIERANLCIWGIRNSSVLENGTKAEQNMMRRLLGEALTLRSILFFDLVKNFGDVPHKTMPTEYSRSFVYYKKDRKRILESVLDDLKEAEAYVPWLSVVGTNEKINKGFVKGLIARVALFRGGCGMTDDGSRPADWRAFYLLANEKCKEVVESGQHKLNPSFMSVFRSQCMYEKDLTYGEPMYELAFGKLNRGELGYYLGVKHDENEKYGKSEAGMYAPPSFFYSFDCSDTRRDVTCACYKYNSSGVQTFSGITSITLAKWRKEWIRPVITGSAKYTGINFTFMRYSDVLLMLAETENELSNGPTDVARKSLSEVRLRAFADSLAPVKVYAYVDSVSADKNMFFNAIDDERAWEFAGESVRKYDLIRWGLLSDKISECKSQLALIQSEDSLYSNVPQKVFWRLSDDGETIIIANIDKLFVDPDFDMTTAKSTKWVSKLNTQFINRVAEGDVFENRFLPIPQTAIDDSNGTLSKMEGGL